MKRREKEAIPDKGERMERVVWGVAVIGEQKMVKSQQHSPDITCMQDALFCILFVMGDCKPDEFQRNRVMFMFW